MGEVDAGKLAGQKVGHVEGATVGDAFPGRDLDIGRNLLAGNAEPHEWGGAPDLYVGQDDRAGWLWSAGLSQQLGGDAQGQGPDQGGGDILHSFPPALPGSGLISGRGQWRPPQRRPLTILRSE